MITQQLFPTSAFPTPTWPCPLQEGHAVYRARTLLSTYGGYDFADDDPSNCGPQALQQTSTDTANANNGVRPEERFGTANKDEVTHWQVAPNPARTNVILSGGDIAILSVIELVDLNGRTLQRWNPRRIANGSLNLDMVNFADGIYYLRLMTHDGYMSAIKISIIK